MDPVAYEIDLLVPTDDFIAAMERLRAQVEPTEDVNTKYGMKVSRAVHAKLDVNPHALRGINAVMSERRYGAASGMSGMGYMQKHLGHCNVSDTVRYQCYRVN